MAKNNQFLIDSDTSKGIDWTTLVITAILTVVGLISIYSATYDLNKSSFFNKQAISALIGLVSLFSIMFVPQRIMKFSAYFLYGMSVCLLLAVFSPLGKTVNGTMGWLDIGGFRLQPSEFAKLGTLFALASFLSQKGKDIRSFRDMGIAFLIVIVPVALIAKQPDFGSATVIMAMFVGVLFWTGFSSFLIYFLAVLPFIILSSLKGNIYFGVVASFASLGAILFRKKIVLTIAAIAMFVGIGISAPIIYSHLEPHQQARIQTFLNPGSDPRGSGYNVWQSMMAVGSGGVYGKGFLKGTLTQLKYIPEQWTDFIFSVPAEEYGFLGAMLVIIFEAMLILRAADISFQSDDKFFSILCFGSATMLLYHCIINIGMVIGVMPVMGIPLPFMSYGGTAIITNLSMIGILMNVFRNQKLNR